MQLKHLELQELNSIQSTPSGDLNASNLPPLIYDSRRLASLHRPSLFEPTAPSNASYNLL